MAAQAHAVSISEPRLTAAVADARGTIAAEVVARKEGDAFLLDTMEKAMLRLRTEALANFGTVEPSHDDDDAGAGTPGQHDARLEGQQTH